MSDHASSVTPRAETTILPPIPTLPGNAKNSSIHDELGRLREILYGNQARYTDSRLNELEHRLEIIRQELSDMINEKFEAVEDVSSTLVTLARHDLSKRLDEQVTESKSALQAAQHTLTTRLDQQELEHVGQMRNIQKELNERIDKLASDFLTQLRGVQRELNERLEQINSEQTERLRTLQTESRQRTNNLRQELLTLAGELSNSKVSRYELGQLLQEMGQRLRQDVYG